jgi:hypothetical protein
MIEKKAITGEIKTLTHLWFPRLSEMKVSEISGRRNSQNRNIKQILGHLIDSATNNTHRIINLQNLPSPLEFPNYASNGNNDRWIAIQDYENEDWNTMISLWKYSQLHLCHVISCIDPDKLSNEWIAGPGRYISLGEMVNDYTRHLRLHLSEIEDLLHESLNLK